MDRPTLPYRTPRTLSVGEKLRFTRTITEADVSLFIGVTWDVNPYHTDESFVEKTPAKRRSAPGLLTASLFTHIGGLQGFLAKEMDLRFLAPAYIGDTFTAEAEVAQMDEESGFVMLKCRCWNNQGETVLEAEIRGYPARLEDPS